MSEWTGPLLAWLMIWAWFVAPLVAFLVLAGIVGLVEWGRESWRRRSR